MRFMDISSGNIFVINSGGEYNKHVSRTAAAFDSHLFCTCSKESEHAGRGKKKEENKTDIHTTMLN